MNAPIADFDKIIARYFLDNVAKAVRCPQFHFARFVDTVSLCVNPLGYGFNIEAAFCQTTGPQQVGKGRITFHIKPPLIPSSRDHLGVRNTQSAA